MKKLLMAFICLFALVALVACNETPAEDNNEENNNGNENGETNNGGTEEEEQGATYYLGMGVVVGLGHDYNNPGLLQVDSTVAAVVFNNEGLIVACRIDALQNKATVTNGAPTSTNTTSKAALGDDYGMAKAINYGPNYDTNGDGEIKEWYEQAQLFEDYVTGKTIEDVQEMTTTTEGNGMGYAWSSDADLLEAGCTIQVQEFIDAVIAACKDGQAVEFTTAEEFTVGVAAIGELNLTPVDHGGAYVPATETTNGTACLYAEYAASVVNEDGEIIATLNDAVQPKVQFGYNGGAVGELNYVDTKRGLMEDYSMANAVNYGPNYDPNNDGKVLEWFEQSAAFSAFVVGMTADDVRDMETAPNALGYQMSTNEDLLEAGCTIQITTIMEIVATSVDNAR